MHRASARRHSYVKDDGRRTPALIPSDRNFACSALPLMALLQSRSVWQRRRARILADCRRNTLLRYLSTPTARQYRSLLHVAARKPHESVQCRCRDSRHPIRRKSPRPPHSASQGLHHARDRTQSSRPRHRPSQQPARTALPLTTPCAIFPLLRFRRNSQGIRLATMPCMRPARSRRERSLFLVRHQLSRALYSRFAMTPLHHANPTSCRFPPVSGRMSDGPVLGISAHCT